MAQALSTSLGLRTRAALHADLLSSSRVSLVWWHGHQYARPREEWYYFTFDHILSRLQGELQKAVRLVPSYILTGATNDIHKTFSGKFVRTITLLFHATHSN